MTPTPPQTRAIKQIFVDEFAADRITPDEVVLKDDGDVVIDRTRRYPQAIPVTVGRWK